MGNANGETGVEKATRSGEKKYFMKDKQEGRKSYRDSSNEVFFGKDGTHGWLITVSPLSFPKMSDLGRSWVTDTNKAEFRIIQCIIIIIFAES